MKNNENEINSSRGECINIISSNSRSSSSSNISSSCCSNSNSSRSSSSGSSSTSNCSDYPIYQFGGVLVLLKLKKTNPVNKP